MGRRAHIFIGTSVEDSYRGQAKRAFKTEVLVTGNCRHVMVLEYISATQSTRILETPSSPKILSGILIVFARVTNKREQK